MLSLLADSDSAPKFNISVWAWGVVWCARAVCVVCCECARVVWCCGAVRVHVVRCGACSRGAVCAHVMWCALTWCGVVRVHASVVCECGVCECGACVCGVRMCPTHVCCHYGLSLSMPYLRMCSWYLCTFGRTAVYVSRSSFTPILI